MASVRNTRFGRCVCYIFRSYYRSIYMGYSLILLRNGLCRLLGGLYGGGLRQLHIGQRLKRPSRLLAPLGFQRTQIAPLPQLPPMLIHHAEVHEEVGAEHVDFDIGLGNVQRSCVAHQLEHRFHQATGAKLLRGVQRLCELVSGLWQRH